MARPSIHPILYQAEGGGSASVSQFDSITALVDASESGLAAGYYEVTSLPASHPDYPRLLTYWDGVAFSPRSLDFVEDYLDDIKIWFNQSDLMFADLSGSAISADTEAVRLWRSRLVNPIARQGSTPPLRSSLLGGSIQTNLQHLEVSDYLDTYDVTGPFEVFATVQLANDVDQNRGVIGKWGSNGWLMGIQNFVAPHDVSFGINGVYATSGSRLGLDPHVISGRYSSDGNVYLNIDGADVGSAFLGIGFTVNNVNNVTIGGYNTITEMAGNIAEIMMIKRELSVPERSRIVANMQSRAGF